MRSDSFNLGSSGSLVTDTFRETKYVLYLHNSDTGLNMVRSNKIVGNTINEVLVQITQGLEIISNFAHFIDNTSGKVAVGSLVNVMDHLKYLASEEKVLTPASILESRFTYKKDGPLYCLNDLGQEFVRFEFRSARLKGNLIVVQYYRIKYVKRKEKEDLVPLSAFPSFRLNMFSKDLWDLFEGHFKQNLCFELSPQLGKLTPSEERKVVNSIFGEDSIKL